MKNRLLLWLVCILISLGLVACGSNATSSSDTSPTTGATSPIQSLVPTTTNLATVLPVRAVVGYTAPDFTVKDVNGQTLQLSSLRGKAILLNFWAVT
ncbi:MAG: redoxin domain-containing protein [Chloroflexi bacterium]|nr:redoxin domain-containing protein [Chloroflexota bacterium]